MKLGRREIIVTVLMACFVSATPFAADDARDFLRKWNVQLKNGEGAIIGSLVTIVPATGRIIVRTAGTEERTVVLALDSRFEIMDGRKPIDSESLQRGDRVLLILDVRARAVRCVYRFQ